MKILSVVGARPQFVKLAPVAAECARRGVEHVIVHTGQHYDPMLSDVFFTDLGIPDPDVHLGVGSGGHGVQTGSILGAMDGVLDAQRPDWVLVRTAGFEFVRPAREDLDRRPRFEPNSLL